MQQVPLRLKLPLTVKTKLKKKTNQQSFAHLQNLFPKNQTRQRNNSYKQQMIKTPPTPNLQFLKQNKMRQAHQQSHTQLQNQKLYIQTSLNDFQQLQDQNQIINGQSKLTCPSHPNKKAKYFLMSNTNIKFCTKCAITMAQRQPVIDEQRYHKINEIQKFRQTIKLVKQVINDKQIDYKQELNSLDSVFDNAVNIINIEFEQIYQNLKSKHQDLITFLQNRYKEIKSSTINYKQLLTKTQTTMDKYLYDVNRNYQDIVQDLSISHFNQIMHQYQFKIKDYLRKLDNTPDSTLQIQNYKDFFSQVKQIVRNLSIQKLKKCIKLGQKKQNWNTLNIKQKGAKTPDRTIK